MFSAIADPKLTPDHQKMRVLRNARCGTQHRYECNPSEGGRDSDTPT